MCRGCTCADGLVSAKVEHHLTNGNQKCVSQRELKVYSGACREWFVSTDQFIRAFIANVRAPVLIEKNMLCDLKLKKLQKTPKKLSQERLREMLTKQRHTESTAIKAASVIPVGFKDVTHLHIKKLTSQKPTPSANGKDGVCKTAIIYKESGVNRYGESTIYPENRELNNVPTGTWFDAPEGAARYFEDDQTKYDLRAQMSRTPFPGLKESVFPLLNRDYYKSRFVCADPDYPDDARTGFSSVAGALYLPPSIQLEPKNEHGVTIECGYESMKAMALVKIENEP